MSDDFDTENYASPSEVGRVSGTVVMVNTKTNTRRRKLGQKYVYNIVISRIPRFE